MFFILIFQNSKVSQQTSGGNVIVLNNNDMMQQRTSLGGQQVKFQKKNEIIKIFYLLNFRLFLKQVHHQHQIQHKAKSFKLLMDN